MSQCPSKQTEPAQQDELSTQVRERTQPSQILTYHQADDPEARLLQHNHKELLRAYVDTGCEQAFAQVVGDYINLVYSAALRQVRDKHLAEEVTQTVFIILARKASTIRWDAVLSAWLLKTTRYTAMNYIRAEARRQAHERKAAEMASEYLRVDSSWQRLSPMLDEAVARLRDKDRAAITLRFFERKSIAEVALAMGVSEQAAAMRVHRAVDKLRGYFRDRRVDLSTSALGGIVWANAVHMAPHGLGGMIAANAIQTIHGAATTALAAAAANADSVIHAMAVAKAKASAVLLSGVLAATLAAGLILSYLLNPLIHRAVEPPQSASSMIQRDGLRVVRMAAIERQMTFYYKHLPTNENV